MLNVLLTLIGVDTEFLTGGQMPLISDNKLLQLHYLLVGCMCVCVRVLQTAGMETDDLQAQLSHLQQLIVDEEQKRHRQKVPVTVCHY